MGYLYSTILSHSSLKWSLSFHLGNAFASDPSFCSAAITDLRAARKRDPACVSFSHCLLNYKGFLACQWLMPSEGGYLEVEGIEKTWRIKQEAIACEVDILSSRNQYVIIFPDTLH